MAQQVWTLGAEINLGLAERGNMLLDQTPIAAINGAQVGNNVLEMRQGMQATDLTGSGLTGAVMWIGRFVTNAGVEEIWAAADNAGTPALARLVSGVWSTVTFSDTPNVSNLIYMQGVGMNGKFFLAYDSNMNRLHVWDGTTLRRVGLIKASTPSAVQDAAGALSFTRFYRVRNTVQSGGVTILRSEPSTAVSITIVNRLGVTVTKGAVSGDGETHWELEAAAAANGPWYRIATTAVGTTTFDDTSASIATTNPSVDSGAYDPPPSAKYLSTDGLSLLMGGAWETTTTATGETTPKPNRVWYTPPLGSSDVGDDERIRNTTTVHGWTDVGDAGPVTALQGPMYGETFVFKSLTVAKLTPTGNVDAPYALALITSVIGCVDQRLLSMGEVAGTPAILFADKNAGYALTAQGGIACITEPIGVDLRGLTIVSDPGLLIYDPLERTVLLQTSNTPPDILGNYKNFLFDCYKRRWEGFGLGGATGGWVLGVSQLGIDTVLGGGGAEILNGCYAEQNGERRLYLCGSDASGNAFIASRGGQAVLDLDEPFTTTIRYRKVFKPGYKATIGCPTVYYTNPGGDSDGLTLTVSYVRDFDEVRSQDKVLAPTDSDSRIDFGVETFEGVACADARVLDLILSVRYDGTAYESPVAPSIACVVVPYDVGEALAQ